jgi:hypothetical protein
MASDKIQTAPPVSIRFDEQLEAQESAIARIEETRAVQEAQAQFVIAKRFPRSELTSERKIIEACKRPSLAEVAEYSYSRGGSKIRGASIRLAETMARYWGNIRYGFRELSQASGVSEVQAYALDMETNTFQERVFHVRHVRYSKGGVTKLNDPRDIYELIANQASRRIRACILALIPGDVQDAALEQCNRTLAGAGDTPLKDRLKRMIEAFGELGVTQAMIETKFQRKAEAIDEYQLRDLRAIYNSLRDGMSSIEQNFPDGEGKVAEVLKKAAEQTEPPSPDDETASDSEPGDEPVQEDAPEPDAGTGDSEQENGEGKRGPISKDEDEEFQEQWKSLLTTAVETGYDEEFVVRVMERLAAAQGGPEGPMSIRNRDKREKFLKDWFDMVEQWSKAPKHDEE